MHLFRPSESWPAVLTEPQWLLPLAASFQARQREALPLWTQLGGVVKVHLLVVLVVLYTFADPVGGPRRGRH